MRSPMSVMMLAMFATMASFYVAGRWVRSLAALSGSSKCSCWSVCTLPYLGCNITGCSQFLDCYGARNAKFFCED
jgi:hypothetical protein